MSDLKVNSGNNDATFFETTQGIYTNAFQSIQLTQAAGKANNKITEAEIYEKLAKKGFDAGKGLIG